MAVCFVVYHVLLTFETTDIVWKASQDVSYRMDTAKSSVVWSRVLRLRMSLMCLVSDWVLLSHTWIKIMKMDLDIKFSNNSPVCLIYHKK